MTYELRQYADDLSIHVRDLTTDTSICALNHDQWNVGELIVKELNTVSSECSEKECYTEKQIRNAVYKTAQRYQRRIDHMEFRDVALVENVLTQFEGILFNGDFHVSDLGD